MENLENFQLANKMPHYKSRQDFIAKIVIMGISVLKSLANLSELPWK